MVRRTLVLLTVALLAFPGVLTAAPSGEVPPDESAVERESEITIRGTYDAPARVSFEYSEPEDVETVRVTTGDSPSMPVVESFPEPRLVKDSEVEAESAIVRPERTVVEEYSMLELLGIGTGVAAVLLLL